VEFKLIAEYFDRLEKISSRIQLTALLTDLLKKSDKDVIDKVIYITQGKLWPDFFEKPEIGLGEKLMIKALSVSTNIKEDEIEKQLRILGDLGEVAYKLKRTNSSQNVLSYLGSTKVTKLTVEEVYESLSKIALSEGEGSRDMKIRSLAGLLKKADPLEAKYIIRFIDGRLRVGIGDATIMDALANVFGGGTAARPLIERAYNLRADLGNIAKLLAENGIETIKSIKPEVGIPIRPMLAERLTDPSEILAKVGGKGIVDYKYDGERAQIHKKGEKVYIFSRRLENITRQYPDVVEYIKNSIKSNEVILEGEIVAIDKESGEILPFQNLMHRKRKNDIGEAIKEYPVNVYLFDLMYNDGEDYTQKPLPDRREKLEEIVTQNDIVKVADHKYIDKVNELVEYFHQAISDGTEGVIVKSIGKDSIYQAGARGFLWIKLKKDYQSEMADSVDLVIVGAFYGRGKRGGKLSSLLMAAYDPDKDTFYTVCKVASGFSDAELEEVQKMLSEAKLDKKDPRVESEIQPDIWVKPKYVAEIIGAEITLSPLHTCCKGVVSEEAGLSIRFPRFIRWRDDKSVEEATTPNEILEMYQSRLKKKVEDITET